MNKQDKIKKVMREFKDGKLKTPNGEVVTDKKQALAIAMSESEDYAEKADLIEDISISSLSHAEDVIKGIGSEELFEKAVYADTAENRKLGRVGQEYHRGNGKKEEKKADKKSSGSKNSWGYEIKPLYTKTAAKQVSKQFAKYLDGEDDGMEFIGSYWKSVANGADEKDLQDGLKHAIHDRVSPGSKDAISAFKEAIADIKHFEDESQKFYNIKKKTEVKKAINDEMGISDAYRELFGDDLEKAHQDGDMHPNGKWVWVSSANGGKGDWRTLNGRTHKKHSETQASNKFLENFKNASDDVLEKIVSGKIQAVDREKKLAQQILDSRKKSANDDSTKKNIDWDDITVTKLNDGGLYTELDKKRQIITIGSKQYRVDFQNESLLQMNSGVKVKSNSTEMSRFKKLLDVNKKKSSSESNRVVNPSSSKKYRITSGQLDKILSGAETKVENGNKKYFVHYTALGKDRGSSWQTKSQIEAYLRGWDDAQVSIPDKKSSSNSQNAHVQKLIDVYKTNNNSYTDTSKMSIVITPKGNWNLRYDGKDVSTISGQRNIMDRKTLEDAGIKFEDPKKRPVGAGTNGPTPKTKADKKVDDATKTTTKKPSKAFKKISANSSDEFYDNVRQYLGGRIQSVNQKGEKIEGKIQSASMQGTDKVALSIETDDGKQMRYVVSKNGRSKYQAPQPDAKKLKDIKAGKKVEISNAKAKPDWGTLNHLLNSGVEIQLRQGFSFRGAGERKVDVKQARESIRKNAAFDATVENGVLHINTYSINDMM